MIKPQDKLKAKNLQILKIFHIHMAVKVLKGLVLFNREKYAIEVFESDI